MKGQEDYLLPIIKSGNMLYALNNGVKEADANIKCDKICHFWLVNVFSAILEDLPPNALLTDNEKIGTNKLEQNNGKTCFKEKTVTWKRSSGG